MVARDKTWGNVYVNTLTAQKILMMTRLMLTLIHPPVILDYYYDDYYGYGYDDGFDYYGGYAPPMRGGRGGRGGPLPPVSIESILPSL